MFWQLLWKKMRHLLKKSQSYVPTCAPAYVLKNRLYCRLTNTHLFLSFTTVYLPIYLQVNVLK